MSFSAVGVLGGFRFPTSALCLQSNALYARQCDHLSEVICADSGISELTNVGMAIATFHRAAQRVHVGPRCGRSPPSARNHDEPSRSALRAPGHQPAQHPRGASPEPERPDNPTVVQSTIVRDASSGREASSACIVWNSAKVRKSCRT